MISLVKTEWPRLIGFCCVGLGGFFVHAAMVLWLTKAAKLGPILAWFPAFLVAVLYTWVLNRLISFKGLGGQKNRATQAAGYAAVQSVGAAINFLIYAGLIALKWPYLSWPIIALACGSGAALIFNYSALRLFIFKAD